MSCVQIGKITILKAPDNLKFVKSMCSLLFKEFFQVFEGCMLLKTHFLVPGLNEDIPKCP